MAKQNRTTLKNYFQTGDKPSQAQYADLIDSNVNLSESNTGNITLIGDITSSNISASGASITDTLTVGTIANINTTHVTASSNISASGTIFTNKIESPTILLLGDPDGNTSGARISVNQSDTTVSVFSADLVVGQTGLQKSLNVTRHITASGNISSSGNMIAETGSFDNGVILKAPNGNQFRFTINNSGHLSLTGSAI